MPIQDNERFNSSRLIVAQSSSTSSGFPTLASQSSTSLTAQSSPTSIESPTLASRSSSLTVQSLPTSIEASTAYSPSPTPLIDSLLVPGGTPSDSDVSTAVSSPVVEAVIEVIPVVSKSTLSKTPAIPHAGSSQNLFTVKNISILTAVGICAVLIIIGLGYFLTRDKKKSTVRNKPEIKASQATFDGSIDYSSTTHTTITTNSSTNGTTMISSNYGLAIPGYLLLKYGVSIRSKKEIARGGFGRILLGEVLDMATIPSSTPVIIKEMIGQVSKKEIDSFYQEVSIMAYLGKHKNIATLYGYTEQPYTIVMKYYPIGSLHGWIYSNKTAKTLSQIFYFALDIAQGVDFMWTKGFCHSDLKPQNVLIDLDVSTDIATCVLTDFGITQIFSDKSLLFEAFKPVNINGASINYAAPEAILKLRRKEHVPSQVLPKFDIYSYAIVLFELVCRRRPL